MTDKKSADPDIFVANNSYPDAAGLFFDGYQTLEQVRDTCLVVLDTNALLVPYGISKNGLSEIASTYKQLADSKRLVVPGQVAREFARNRPVKIAEIFQAISRKRNLSHPDKGRYPLLEDAPSYQKLRELEDQIAKLIGEYRGSIGDLLSHIQKWNWNDPVSRLYSQLFPGVVVDPTVDKDCVRKRLEYQRGNRIPPGYKDSAKLDQGIGDLLVWQAVVKVAQERKLPVVLVSGDSKADWFYRSEGQALFPRFELVDEIRRVSDGKSLHIVSFSKFLELFGAAAEAVGEARSEEIKIDLSTMSPYGRHSVLSYLAEQAVSDWLQEKYPELATNRDDRNGGYGLSERGGANVFVSVKYFPAARPRPLVGSRLRDTLARFERGDQDREYDNILVFLVFESEMMAEEAADRLPNIVRQIGHPDSSVVVGHLPHGGSLRIRDPLNSLPTFQ